MVTLPWFNCYSFGNGVESDRVRDDYNQVTIDNGPKASTTIEGTYVEDRKKNGFIWSGIYNSTSGVNNLNQFIQAEAITKDINPSYGSIQKMFVRDSDLVAYCEDRVLKIYANKDALYNADGNTNVVATNKVLGAVKPFVGDYGISKNPESFASDNYRSYFADTSRGAVLRLSMDGITPISNVGMKDWFSDIMPMYATKTGSSIIGSFDDKKEQYNITFRDNPYDKEGMPRMLPPAIPPVYVPGIGNPPGPPAPTNPNQGSVAPPPSSSASSYGSQTPLAAAGAGGAAPATFGQLVASQQPVAIPPTIQLRVFDEKSIPQTTVSFNEPSKAWVSFKSWIQEGGVSLNNSYYTFSGGELWRHHDMETRNNFYGTQYESSVRFLFNQGPSIIKSFSTLNYEGTQARVTQDIINNPDYYDNIAKSGWYVNSITSNAQEIGELEFWDKEDKWFSQIKGTATKWLNDGTAGNIDPREFSYQGIGNADGGISCPDCPEQMSWTCGAVSDAWQYSCCDGRPTINQQFDTSEEAIDWFFDNPTVPIRSIFQILDPTGNYVPASMCGGGIGSITDPSTMPNNTNNFVGQYANSGNEDGIGVDFNSNNPVGFVTQNGWNGTGRAFTVDSLDANHYVQWFIDNVDNAGAFFLGMTRAQFMSNFYNWDFMYPGLLMNWTPWGCGNIVAGGGGSAGCVEVAGGSGYSTQQECIDSGCGQATESWTCGGDSGCMDPGDGTGQYATECDCAENCCDSSVIRFFDCQNLSQPNFLVPGCMDDGVTQDSWIIANRPATWVGPASNFNNNANYDDCNCIYSTATSWDCDGLGNCSESPDGTGAYATFADCDINCAAPALPCAAPIPISWDCDGLGNCSDPGDGSGQYASLSSCQSNCPQQAWECINGGCVNNGVGQYATYADCSNHCFPVTYNCTYDNQMINCIDPGNGTGFYAGPTALNDCQNDPNSICLPAPPVAESWNCSYDYTSHVFACVDPGDGTGVYATNALCLADQFSDCALIVLDPEGCTDPCACDYDLNATIDNGSCHYDCDTLDDLPTSEMDYLNSNSPACLADPNCSGLSSTNYTTVVGAHQNSIALGGSYAWYWQTAAYGNMFPNNENVWNTVICSPNYGVYYDVRNLRFEVNFGPSGLNNNLSIRHVNLDAYYGQRMQFYTWADYIDAAVATGLPGMGALINPSLANTPDYSPQGYMAQIMNVNTTINQAFVNGNYYAAGSTSQTPCQASSYSSPDCDRTSSKFCEPCTAAQQLSIATYGVDCGISRPGPSGPILPECCNGSTGNASFNLNWSWLFLGAGTPTPIQMMAAWNFTATGLSAGCNSYTVSLDGVVTGPFNNFLQNNTPTSITGIGEGMHVIITVTDSCSGQVAVIDQMTPAYYGDNHSGSTTSI